MLDPGATELAAYLRYAAEAGPLFGRNRNIASWVGPYGAVAWRAVFDFSDGGQMPFHWLGEDEQRTALLLVAEAIDDQAQH